MDIPEKKPSFFASSWIDERLNDRLINFIKRNQEYTRSRFIREAIREKLERS